MKKTFALLLSAAFAAASFSGCALFPDEEEALAPPLKAPTAVTYTTTTAALGEILDTVSIGGTFIATSSYDLSFGTRSGYLTALNVKSGDVVKKGDILALLDSEDLELQVAQQKITLQRAELALEMAKSSSGANSYAAKIAQLDVDSATLNLNRSLSELEKLTIYAPIDGVVSYITPTTIGEYIQGRQTVVRVVDPTHVQIQCEGDEVSEFQLGAEVILTYKKEEYGGHVVMTTREKPDDIQIQGAFIRAEFDEALPFDNLELIGKSLNVKLIKEKKSDVIVLPRNTVSSYGGESYVLVLEDGVKKERPVVTGIRTGSMVEIVEGIEPGEEIIIK